MAWRSGVLSGREIVPLVLFVALVLAAALQGLAASGHFPLRKGCAHADVGPALLFSTMIVSAAGAGFGIVAAFHFISWPSAVIGGGLALLGAPLVLQWFPDRFVDGRGALIAFAAAAAILATLLVWLAVGIRCGGCG